MQLEEGQVYEGGISISGDDGPFRRWLVVSPFGKTHIHCVDDPLDLHCWPVKLIEWGVESGRLSYIGKIPEHPAIQVQRVKEQLGVRDTHLSIPLLCIERLVEALRAAVDSGEDYAVYLAGEIISSASHSALLQSHRERLISTVHTILGEGEFAAPSLVPIRINTSEAGSDSLTS
ncbi:MAG: hypothetical protein KKA36_00770 [Gammaproteobacteria bacterium]|nr:hypothetical protein [Gammaproteobacteria bacterium]MBU2477594.1 hypothetical protein [Gammaproteobacteria bacterium]